MNRVTLLNTEEEKKIKTKYLRLKHNFKEEERA